MMAQDDHPLPDTAPCRLRNPGNELLCMIDSNVRLSGRDPCHARDSIKIVDLFEQLDDM